MFDTSLNIAVNVRLINLHTCIFPKGRCSLHKFDIFFRSIHRRCYVRKGVLGNFTKFTGKHLCQSLFFNKVVGLERQSGNTGGIQLNFDINLKFRGCPRTEPFSLLNHIVRKLVTSFRGLYGTRCDIKMVIGVYQKSKNRALDGNLERICEKVVRVKLYCFLIRICKTC